ncbi:MAG: GNAT family N-acetyltransferase [Clostridia bacterium]|nr:GNAT family N-acetyltransferase [Clostridia bacterium]
MIVYRDDIKALPADRLTALFRAVGWTTEAGEAAHAAHFNTPFVHSAYVVSAWDGEALIGCVRVLGDTAVRSVIYDLAVLPAYQGQGIGRELVRRCIARWPQSEWLVQTEPETVGFYEKLGFRVLAAGERDVFLHIPCAWF